MPRGREDAVHGHAFEATMTRVVPIGLVPEELRLNAHYQGQINEGPLTGDTVDGVDYFLLRRDGVGVVDVRQVFSGEGGRTVATEVHGYVAAPSPVPPLEAVHDERQSKRLNARHPNITNAVFLFE